MRFSLSSMRALMLDTELPAKNTLIGSSDALPYLSFLLHSNFSKA